MALTARDVILVLRAKDEASSVIRNVGRNFNTLGADAQNSAYRMIAAGSALASLGAGMAGAGIGLLTLTKSFVDASIDYRQQAALALTQVDGFTTSVEELMTIGHRVADEIPVPLQELQAGLYDIFSSMDVNLQESERILNAFSRGAVAGQTSLQSAGRATIAIMNAFGLEAHDVDRVMDVQFQLVRKGVGTYQEFADTIGLSLPAAARAGQGIEELGGMLAFLTRNGLSASRASTSAGRALETLAHPTVIKRMEDLGVAVLDGEGNFRKINDIVTDLGTSLSGLTDAQKAKALQELFAGAGNSIQARRFWDLAIRNFDDLNGFVDDMYNSRGQMDAAYDIMFEQPQSQIQLLKNKLDILKTTLGEALMPTIDKLVEKGIKFLDWLNGLDDSTKEVLAKAIALAGVVLTLAGAATGAAGAFLIFAGAIKLMGGLSTVLTLFSGVGIALALIAGAAYLVYRNWDKIKPYLEEYWPKVKAKALDAWEAIRSWVEQHWPAIKAKILEILQAIWDKWQEIWPKIKSAAQDVWDWIEETAPKVWDAIKEAWGKILEFVEDVRDFWEEAWPVIKEVTKETWDWIVKTAPKVWDALKKGFEGIKSAIEWLEKNIPKAWDKLKQFGDWLWNELEPGIMRVWEALEENFIPAVQGVIDIVQELYNKFLTWWPAIQIVIMFAVGLIVLAFQNAWPLIKLVWDSITNLISTFIEMFRGWIDIIAGILEGDWGRVWDGVKRIVKAAFGFVIEQLWIIVQAIWDILQNAWKNAQWVWSRFKDITLELLKRTWDERKERFWSVINWIGERAGDFWAKGEEILHGLWDGIKVVWELVKGWFTEMPGKILGLMAEAPMWLYEKGKSILLGMKTGIEVVWEAVKDWFGSIDDKVLGAVGDLSDILYNVGKLIMNGLKRGLEAGWESVKGWLSSRKNAIISLKGPPYVDAKLLLNNGQLIMRGLREGMQSEWARTERWLSDVGPSIGGFGPVAATSTGGGGTTVTIAEGAVRIEIGNVSSQDDVDRIEEAVQRTLREVLFETR